MKELLYISRRNKPLPFVILVMQGGLGNQLFQAAALATLSESHEFQPIILDSEVNLNYPSLQTPPYLDLSIESWFNSTKIPIIVRGRAHKFIHTYYRICLKLWPERVKGESFFKCEIKRLPFFFPLLIKHSFFFKSYPLSIQSRIDNSMFSKLQKDFPIDLGEVGCVVHIRLGDLIQHAQLDPKWYAESLQKLQVSKGDRIACFSDDIMAAKEIVSQIHGYTFFFPEERASLQPSQLLYLLTLHPKFIGSSASSFSWWVCFIRWLNNPNDNVIIPLSDFHEFRQL